MARKREIYIAIMAAAAHGRGLRLSPDEVWTLARDEAIGRHAANCLSKDDPLLSETVCPEWGTIDPYVTREPANRCA